MTTRVDPSRPPSTSRTPEAGGERFGFAPDPARTDAVSTGVRISLAQSVERILAALAGSGAAVPGGFADWRLRLVANPRPSPQLWAVYHDLVQAALGERVDAASALAAELLARDPAQLQPAGAVITFSAQDLGPDLARSLAVVDNDPVKPLRLRTPEEGELARLGALLPACRALLEAAAPELQDEIDALGHQVLLGVGEGARFGGAASIFLWGAVVLNPTLVVDRVDLAEALAHETAHALLFGLVLGANLTLNDPAERYASPLRQDPRPIEGLAHAVYVLARMVWALRRLDASDALTPGERGRVAGKIERNLALFHAGLQTVDAHARFTPDGEAIFAACRQAMAVS